MCRTYYVLPFFLMRKNALGIFSNEKKCLPITFFAMSTTIFDGIFLTWKKRRWTFFSNIYIFQRFFLILEKVFSNMEKTLLAFFKHISLFTYYIHMLLAFFCWHVNIVNNKRHFWCFWLDEKVNFILFTQANLAYKLISNDYI